jgi:hypothetical protein
VAERERFVDQDTAEALKRQQQLLRPFWRDYGRPVSVWFKSAGALRQVAHGLTAAPDGYLVVRATGHLFAVTPEKWTNNLALLQSPDVNTRAILIFFTLREDAIDV